MHFGINRTIMVIAAFVLIFQSCVSVREGRCSPDQDTLPTGAITIDPAFATVGERSELFVTVAATDPELVFTDGKLTLKRQEFLKNGSTRLVPIGQLRDDGKEGDEKALLA